MAKTESSKLRRRADRAEELAVAFGFLLKMLNARYSDDFGHGMAEQMRQALKDLNDLERSIQQRQVADATGAPTHGDGGGNG